MTPSEKKVIANEIISEQYKVTMEELKTSKRERRFSFPRHVWWWMMRVGTGSSLTELARQFDKDHATTLHGIRNINNQIYCSHDFCKELEVLCQKAADKGWRAPAHAFLQSSFVHSYSFPKDFGKPRYERSITVPKDVVNNLTLERMKFNLVHA